MVNPLSRFIALFAKRVGNSHGQAPIRVSGAEATGGVIVANVDAHAILARV